MIGLGTIINIGGILLGGMLGLLFGGFLNERMQMTLMKTMGVCTAVLGLAGTMEKMLVVENGQITSRGSLLLILSLVLGAIIGELLDIEKRFTDFGEWLKQKSGNGGDAGFTDAFVTASLTVAIGAMAVIGSINDGLFGDYSVLTVKALLDLVIIMIMTSIMGRGCIFSAIPVGILEGGMTLLARLISPLLNEQALAGLSMVGSVLILLIGMNLIWPKLIRVSNLLPAIILSLILAQFLL
ncbi:MAG: DUF554 domain-containing protein [Lachnospiraceae bacterium]|nr:DUF554 domain-containing protein [Lachnospiraceae bacterium]